MTLLGPLLGNVGVLPRALAVRSEASLYVADTLNHQVWEVDGATRLVVLFAGTGVARFSGDGRLATLATLREPWGLAVDELRDRLLIADTANNRIRYITFATGIILTLAGDGAAASDGDGGDARAASILAPRGVLAAGSGIVYVAESGAHKLRRISTSGVITTIAGTGGRGFRAGTLPASTAALNNPSHLALSPNGATLYIADTDNSAVRALALGSGELSTLAGNGSYAWTSDGALATEGGFTRILGLAVDLDGVVYFSDSGYGVVDRNGGNNCIRAVDPSGILRTAVGLCRVFPHSYSEGSQATSALLDEPSGLAFAPDSRRLHISSYGHNTVLLVTLPAPLTPSVTRSRSPAATRSRTGTRKAKRLL